MIFNNYYISVLKDVMIFSHQFLPWSSSPSPSCWSPRHYHFQESIICIWLYHISCLVFMSSTKLCQTPLISRMWSLRILLSFKLPADRHQKFISVGSKDFFALPVLSYLSLPLLTMLLTMVMITILDVIFNFDFILAVYTNFVTLVYIS